MPARSLIIFLFVALASPIVAAAPTSLHAELVVDAVVADAANTLDGGLIVFTRGDAGGSSASPADFEAQGAHIHVSSYSLAPSTYPIALYDQPQTDQRDFYQATVRGLVNRPGYQAAIYPSGTVTASLQASCSHLESSSSQRVERVSQVYYSPAPNSTMVADTVQALQWFSCGQPGSLKLQGDFVLMLWQWDSEVSSDGRTVFLPSGHDRYEYDPIGSPETQGVVSHDRQQYLYITNGTLTIPLGADPTEQLYLADVAARTTSTFTLTRPQGQLTDGIQVIDVDAHEMHVAATELRLQGRASQTPVRVMLQAPSSAINIDGQPLQFTSTVGSPLETAWAWLVAVGAVLAPMAAWPVLRRRRALRPSLEWRIETLLGQRRTGEALALSQDHLRQASPAARLLHARVLAHSGSLLDAHDQHAWLGTQSLAVGVAAENALQAASVAAKLHRQGGPDQAAWRERTVAWMKDCLRLNPDLEPDLLMLLELEPFWEEVRPAQLAR